MMSRAVIWLPDAERGLCEVRGERLIDGTLRVLRENHIFEVLILCRGDAQELERWCRTQHLELMIDVVSLEDESGTAYRLFDVRSRLEGSGGDVIYLDGRVAFESEILRRILAIPQSVCAVEPEIWDATSPRASVESGAVLGISTSLTRKSSSGRALGFFKFDAASLTEVFSSIANQLSYSGDLRTTLEQVIDRLIKSGRIKVSAALIEPGSWFFVENVEVGAEDSSAS